MAILNSLNKINDFLDTSSAGKFLGGSKVLPQVGATLFNAAINPNGNSTGIGNTIQSVSSFIPGIGGAIGQVAGGLINTTFGSNINEEFVDRTNNSIDNLNSFYSTATDSTSLMNDWGNAGFMSHVNKDDVGSEGIFSNKASNHAKALNSKIDLANKRAYMGLFNTAANISKNNALSALASSYALGGQLSHGGIFDDAFTTIDSGGTHETNPNNGVPIGVDPSGIPNLVEEGEVIWNDYVFSNRLKVPNKVKKKYGLKDNSTFAEAIKKFTKESEELPHDPITKRGMNAIASELAGVQEGERVKKDNSNVGNMFDEGGFIKEVDPLGLLGQTVNFYPASATDLLNAKRYSSTPVTMKTLNPKLPDPIKQDPLRYVPIAASSAAVLNDFLGGNKPDYSNLSTYENAIKRSYRPVAARRINSYLTYKPFDVERPINALNANTAASRRAILDNSGGNRATALTGLFALDRGYNNSIGDLYDKAFATNLTNKAKVEEYNRATDTYNNDQATKADMFNTELLGKQASMYGQLASAKQRILEANRLERMNNLTNFITNLSNLGRENTDRDTLRWLAEIGALPYDARGRFKGGA